MPRVVSVSASLSSVSATPLVIVNDGVESSVVTIRVMNTDGKPMGGLAASNIVLAVSGTNNTVTQPTGATDNEGYISGSFVSTSGATKVASWTVLGTAITATQSVLVTADMFSLGAGPNAPAWSGKTVYDEELFDAPIAVHPDGVTGASGFRGYGGFEGYFGTAYEYTYTSYPVASTPIGTKPVLRVNFPGQTQNITAVSQTTTAWLTGKRGCSIRVTGTWSGTLSFERSTDGGTNWSAVTGEGAHGGTTGSSTTVNGAWVFSVLANSRFRVRASAWTSGTATVDVGLSGGDSPASMLAGSFTSRPTRIYTRCLIYVDAAWSNNGNAGTKFTFFSQDQGNNHFLNLWEDSGSVPKVALQQTASNVYTGSAGPANGNWLDLEVIITSGTAGGSDGTAQMWINDTLLLNQTGIPYFAAATSVGFPNLSFDPTYGGGRRPPNANYYVDIAGWYRESAP